MSRQKQVLVVGSNDERRGQFVEALEGHPELILLAAVESCAAAREQLSRCAPDAFILDYELPDGDAVDLMKEVRGQHPDTKIMVITEFGDEAHALAAIEAGAVGYLLAGCSAHYIVNAILEMLSGGSPISAPIARYLLKRFQKPMKAPLRAPPSNLTRREQQVLEYLAKGFTFGEISRILGLSSHTVASHVKHIYQKLEVRSRAEAVYEAVQLGLIDLDTANGKS